MRRELESRVRRAYEMLVKGKRSGARHRMRWRDVVQRDMKQEGIDDATWKDRNQGRKVCRAADPV